MKYRLFHGFSVFVFVHYLHGAKNSNMCFALQQNKALATKKGTKAAVVKVTGKKDIFFFLFSCWGFTRPYVLC